jgi:hypothetical protein
MSLVSGTVGAVLGADATESAGNAAANATTSAAQTGADAAREATAAQIASNEKMYNQGREDFAPFRNLAPESLATLQSAIYSKEVDGRNAQVFDLKNFQPEGTPAYEWQKKRGLEDLRTQLMMQGRPSGTVAANANARFLGDLNAREYESGYNRLFTQKQDYINNLLNLGKMAQGAAGSTGTLGQSAAGNMSSAYNQQGQTLANLAGNQGNALASINMNQGQTLGNLYSGLGSQSANAVSTGLKAYDLYNKYNAASSAAPAASEAVTYLV